MTFTRETEYSVVLDACVLVPVSLCDLLLRLAEEPSMYRPVWSERILTEMTSALRAKLHRTSAEAAWRRQQMIAAFPEAMVTFAAGLLGAADCVPDRDDRHVLAAAIAARADTIVTQNIRHFPVSCLQQFGVRRQTADDFLVEQYHRSPQLILDKLDDQAAGIAKDRGYVIASLKSSAKEFAKLVEIQVRRK